MPVERMEKDDVVFTRETEFWMKRTEADGERRERDGERDGEKRDAERRMVREEREMGRETGREMGRREMQRGGR